MDAGELASQVLGEAPLVAGVEVGEEEADRDRLGAGLADRRREALGLSVRQRLDDPFRADPLGRLEAQLRVDQRRRARRAEAVEVGPVLAADLEQVGEAARGDQCRPRPAFLEQGVGAHRHPVREGVDRRGLGARPAKNLLDRGDHADRLIVRGGRSFAVWIDSPSTRTASVKVPPTSTPKSTA